MSTKDFTWKEYKTFIVEYTHSGGKVGRLAVGAETEGEALEDARKQILVSHQPEFTIRVVDVQIYKKK